MTSTPPSLLLFQRTCRLARWLFHWAIGTKKAPGLSWFIRQSQLNVRDELVAMAAGKAAVKRVKGEAGRALGNGAGFVEKTQIVTIKVVGVNQSHHGISVIGFLNIIRYYRRQTVIKVTSINTDFTKKIKLWTDIENNK